MNMAESIWRHVLNDTISVSQFLSKKLLASLPHTQ